MWLMKKSRKVVSVSTSMKDECVSLPKPKSQLAQLHDDDEDIFATSVIDRYTARPLALQDICLATFAVTYDVIQSSTQTEETDDMNTQQDMYNTDNPETSTKIKLQKGLGIIRKRKQQAILCTRRYKIHTEPEKYYHAKLLLYYPWKQEDDIISTYQSYQDSYMNKQHIIHQNAPKFNEDCVAFDINIQDLEHNIPQSAWEMVASNIAHDDNTTNATGFSTIQNQDISENTTHEDKQDNTKNTTDTLYAICKSSKKARYEFT